MYQNRFKSNEMILKLRDQTIAQLKSKLGMSPN